METKKSIKKQFLNLFKEDAKRVLKTIEVDPEVSQNCLKEIVKTESDVDDIIGNAIMDNNIALPVDSPYAILLMDYVIAKLPKL